MRAAETHACVQRPQRNVEGVHLRDYDAVHLTYDISVSAVTGDFRASVMLSRHMLKCATFSAWSVHELAFLFFVHCGVPAQYHLAPTQRWMDCLCLWSNQMVADKLREMSGSQRDKHPIDDVAERHIFMKRRIARPLPPILLVALPVLLPAVCAVHLVKRHHALARVKTDIKPMLPIAHASVSTQSNRHEIPPPACMCACGDNSTWN